MVNKHILLLFFGTMLFLTKSWHILGSAGPESKIYISLVQIDTFWACARWSDTLEWHWPLNIWIREIELRKIKVLNADIYDVEVVCLELWTEKNI